MRNIILLACIVFSSFLGRAQYMVGFAEIEKYNGIYTEDGTVNGKAQYSKSNLHLKYKDCTVKWVLFDHEGGCPDYSSMRDSITPPTDGWGKGSNGNVRVGNLALAKINSIAYDSRHFVESVNNDGSFTDSINILLYAPGNSFVGSNGDDFVSNGNIVASNVPEGLTLQVIRKSDSTLTAFLTGSVENHTTGENIDNLEIHFNSSAFTNGSDGLDNVSAANIKVLYQKQYLVINADNVDANGTYSLHDIRAEKPLYTKGSFFIHYKGCSTKWALSDTDGCPLHKTQEDGDDVPLQGWDVITVLPYNTLYFNKNTITEAIEDNGSFSDSINISFPAPVNGNTFSGVNGDDFVAEGKIIVSNLPSGLGAQAIRLTDTLITVKFTGNAVEHEYENSIDNLSIQVANTAFTDNNASGVEGRTSENISMLFTRLIAVGYANTNVEVNGIFQSFAVVNGKLAYKNERGYYLGYRNCDQTMWVIVKVSDGEGDTEGIQRITNELRTCPQYSSPAITEEFPRTAWGQGGHGASNGLHDLIEVNLLNTIVFDTHNVSESLDNDGSINDSIVITHWYPEEGNAFVGSNGDDFIAQGYLQVFNLPEGFSATAIRNSDTSLVVRFDGNAVNHAFSDYVQNVNFSFTNGAFLNNDMSQIKDCNHSVNLVYSKKYYVVSGNSTFCGIYNAKGIENGKPYFTNGNAILGYRGRGYKWVFINTTEEDFITSKLAAFSRTQDDGDMPVLTGWQGVDVYPYNTLIYSKTEFKESITTRGEIDNSSPLIISYVPNPGMRFSGVNGDDFVADGKIDIRNLPGGLAVVAERVGDTLISVTINGKTAGSDLNNLTFEFKDIAFDNTISKDVYQAQKQDLSIDFHGEFYVASVGGDFSTIKEAVNSELVKDGDVLILNNETFTENNIGASKSLTFRGQGVGKTIVQAAETAETASFRIFSFNHNNKTIYLENMTLQNGYTTNGGGACVYIYGSRLYVDNCYFKDNVVRMSYSSSSGSGGAIHANNSSLMITNSTFDKNIVNMSGGNYGNGGGAIYSDYSQANSTIVNCTFSENDAGTSYGGAIYARNVGQNLSVNNCTFYKNTSGGNNIAVNGYGGVVTLYNSLFVNNNTNNVTATYCVFDTASVAYTYGNDANCITNVDAKVSPLAWNGGSTPTCAIGSDSPAIDAANSSLSPEQDQRGVSAVGTHDIGAYEFTNNPILLVSESDLEFGKVNIGESKELHYLLSGHALPESVTITAPTNCELSLYSGDDFAGTTSLFITTDLGAINNTVVYVRYTPSDNTELNNIITNIPEGITGINVNVIGSGNALPVFNAIGGVSIDENSEEGDEIFTLSATDGNVDDILAYSTTDSRVFVNSITGVVSIADASYFDAETNETLSFEVKVSDGFSEDTENVSIAINNVNDNAPVFASIPTDLNIDENSATGTALLTISATDADGSLNTLVYSSEDAKVVVDASTGAVTLAADANLDYETATSLQFEVTVSDGTNQDTENVSIAINNVNDNAPEFTSIPTDLNIDENSAAGTALLTISSTDADGSLNSLVYSSEDSRVVVDASTGAVTLAADANLDYETATSLQFEVTVSDGTNQDTENVSIAINNVNDNAPAFAAVADGLNIDENSATGTTLLTLSATDADGALNSLVYSSEDARVVVDASTGAVTLAADANLDYETATCLQFEVTVSDGTNQDTENVSIAINNVNDNAPVFDIESYSSEIRIEDLSENAILTVSATDADNLSALTYQLVDGLNIFSMNDEGSLFVENPENLNSTQSFINYTMVATVSDGELSSTADIVVTVDYTSGVATTKAADIQVYPNPTYENITLSIPYLEENTMLRIYSIDGVLIREENINSTETTIQVGDLNSGLYLISINSAKLNVTQRIVKH